jgi:hypothetical protein
MRTPRGGSVTRKGDRVPAGWMRHQCCQIRVCRLLEACARALPSGLLRAAQQVQGKQCSASADNLQAVS